jgi:hypothetical protein
MLSVKEPVIFFSIYLHRQIIGNRDRRSEILHELDNFTRNVGLIPEREDLPFGKPGDIDLEIVDQISFDYLLLNRSKTSQTPPGQPRRFHQLIIYSYHDALIIQIQSGRSDDWSGTLETGWEELSAELTKNLNLNSAAYSGNSAVIGMSLLYWCLCADEAKPADYRSDVSKVGMSYLRQSTIDVGMLWCSGDRLYPQGEFREDRWILLTSTGSDSIGWRYYRTHALGASPFAQFALAKHKIFFELDQFYIARKEWEWGGPAA